MWRQRGPHRRKRRRRRAVFEEAADGIGGEGRSRLGTAGRVGRCLVWSGALGRQGLGGTGTGESGGARAAAGGRGGDSEAAP